MRNKIFTAIFIVALIAFMITVSIGLPIYCRFFYYIQIKTLHLEETTGWSYDVIKEAYDDVLNYLTLPGFEFATGQLKWSSDGASHFADCKVLFNLNLGVLLGSAVLLIVTGVLVKLKKVTLCRPFGHSACLVSAVAAIALPVILFALIAAVGFDEAFEVFHAIFFPGKTNWVFNARTDEVIKIMPEQFFMNCAILIGVGLVVFAAALIIYDAVTFKKRKNKAETSEQTEKTSQK